jgi:hypothetical protein
MIFDSSAMRRLRLKYSSEPDFSAPRIVLIDRSTKFAGEREYLEQLVSQALVARQRDWIGRLLNEDHAQFMGAWFEIMLYGWLLQKRNRPWSHGANLQGESHNFRPNQGVLDRS